jgi:hypothetical protein
MVELGRPESDLSVPWEVQGGLTYPVLLCLSLVFHRSEGSVLSEPGNLQLLSAAILRKRGRFSRLYAAFLLDL